MDGTVRIFGKVGGPTQNLVLADLAVAQLHDLLIGHERSGTVVRDEWN